MSTAGRAAQVSVEETAHTWILRPSLRVGKQSQAHDAVIAAVAWQGRTQSKFQYSAEVSTWTFALGILCCSARSSGPRR
jgi:hypothetical protein